MKKLAILIVVFGAFFVSGVQGQVFVQNTLYPFSKTLYNPGASGMQGGTHVMLMGRLQWLGIDGGPRLFVASGDTPLDQLQSGVGAYIIADKLGPLSTTGVNVSYSYHLNITDRIRLGIGAQGGILQKAINGDFRYDISNGEDPLVPIGQFSSSVVVPNLAAGMFLQGLDDEGLQQFYFGVSATDLLEPSIEELALTPGIGDDSRVSRSYYATAGYRFSLGETFDLEPSVLFRTDGASSQLDISAYLTLKSLVMVGASFRALDADSFSGSLGVKLNDNAFIAYAYDYTLSSLNINGDVSTHELILSYTFPKIGRKPGGIFNTKEKQNTDL